MIPFVIEWCARDRFLVFTGTVLLVLAGIWSLQQVPLDALPDISDVQVVIHTEWAGEPPNVIEDQVTYPLVTTFLSIPRVKVVRGQSMFSSSFILRDRQVCSTRPYVSILRVGASKRQSPTSTRTIRL